MKFNIPQNPFLNDNVFNENNYNSLYNRTISRYPIDSDSSKIKVNPSIKEIKGSKKRTKNQAEFVKYYKMYGCKIMAFKKAYNGTYMRYKEKFDTSEHKRSEIINSMTKPSLHIKSELSKI